MFVVGIDIGTQSLKAVVLGEDLRLLGAAARAYEPRFPQPLWAEQDPALWLDALRPAIAGNVPHHQTRSIHVFGIVRTCLDYPGGLTELISVIRIFADDSASLSRLDGLIAEMGLDGA